MGRRRKQLPVDPVFAHIDALDHDGRGVARVDDKVVFVDGALAGEDVMFRYTRQRGSFDEGRVAQVLRSAAERVEPRCPHFGVCGGCSLQHMAPEAQVRFKQARLMENLEHLGGVTPESVLDPLTGPLWGYRRKARLGAKYVEKKGRLLVGFREKGSNFLTDLSRCEVLHPSVGHRIEVLNRLISSLDCARQVPQVEVAVSDHATLLVLRHLAPLSEADVAALEGFAEAEGVSLYSQSGGPDSVAPLAPKGGTELHYRLDAHAVDIRFLPGDFTQVNTEINRRMVDQALELLAPGPDEGVLDLFCGLGNFTLPLARRASFVTGVEGAPGLVARARENAVRNGIANVAFHSADLSRMDPLPDWWPGRCHKLLLDPPRSGAIEIVRALRAPYPARIVYVSCNPATLARDAGELVKGHGYRLLSAGVMDMFPHTRHVESLALFERP